MCTLRTRSIVRPPNCGVLAKIWGIGNCVETGRWESLTPNSIYIIIFYLCISGNPQKGRGMCVCKIIIIIIFHLYISCLSSQQEKCLCPWLALLGGLTQAKCAGISSLAQI